MKNPLNGIIDAQDMEGLARALTAAVYVAKTQLAELADTYTITYSGTITFTKKDTK